MKAFVILILLLLQAPVPLIAWVIAAHKPKTPVCASTSKAIACDSRRHFLNSLITGSLVTITTRVAPAQAQASEVRPTERLNLSDLELKEIVKQDLVQRQFLVTGNLTPHIYKPTATFTDEVYTYKMDEWMKGTNRLFVGEKSDIRLIGDVDVSPEKVQFRFDGDLMFRIPLHPTLALSGIVVLTRDVDGFITSYREFWDNDIFTVLRSAKF